MTSANEGHIVQTIKEYGRSLMNFIRRRVKSDADAEDILQDVWTQFSSVVNAGPIEQTGAWLFKVARNRIIDKHKKKSEMLVDEEDDSEAGTDLKEFLMTDSNTPETEYLRSIFWKQFFDALEELPHEQRQVFLWHELEGLSFADIAELTGEKTNTLITRKRYAVLHLRNRLRVLRDEILIY